MPTCAGCDRTIMEVNVLTRVNEKGIPSVSLCNECMDIFDTRPFEDQLISAITGH